VARQEAREPPLHEVRIWRPLPDRRMVAMSGRTSVYSFSPVDEFVIGTIRDGPLVVRRHRQVHTFLPGESCVWDPEHAHTGSAPAAAWGADLVIVPGSELADAFDGDVALETASSPEVVDRGTRQAVAELHRSLSSRDRLAVEVKLTAVARHLFARRAPPAKSTSAVDARLHAALDLLIDCIADNVSLAELAAVAGMDRFHFARQFKASFGLPPHAYRLHMRLLVAQRALEAGRPVAEVAATAGFFDQSHLHRHFQRRYGLSPARYAAAFTGSPPARVAD
jgi:AraC-like DNA-binding protein